jgi:hypothetical protein
LANSDTVSDRIGFIADSGRTETETRHVFGIGNLACIVFILSLIPGISISLVGEKIHRLGFAFTNTKKCLRFFFQYG